MINLLSKTGLGRSGHVRFQTFGPIWYVSGPKMYLTKWDNDSASFFAGETYKSSYFDQKPLYSIKITPKIKKIGKNRISR